MGPTPLPAWLCEPGLPLVTFLAGLCWVGVLDLRHRRVPNAATVGLLVAGLAARLLLTPASEAASEALDGLAGAALGTALLIGPFAARWVGGADVKAAAALGAWVGLAALPATLAAGLVVGGAMAVAMLAAMPELRRQVAGTFRTAALLQAPPDPGPRPRAWTVPHVTAFAMGAAALVLTSAAGR